MAAASSRAWSPQAPGGGDAGLPTVSPVCFPAPSPSGRVSLVVHHRLLHPRPQTDPRRDVRSTPVGQQWVTEQGETAPRGTVLTGVRPPSPGTAKRKALSHQVWGTPQPAVCTPGGWAREPGFWGTLCPQSPHWLLVKHPENGKRVEDQRSLWRRLCPCVGVEPTPQPAEGPPFPTRAPSSPHDPLTSEEGSKFQGVCKAEAGPWDTSRSILVAGDPDGGAPARQQG